MVVVAGELRFESHDPRRGRCLGGVPLAAEVLRNLERRRRSLSETVAGFAAKRAAAALAHEHRVAEIDRLEVAARATFDECLAAIEALTAMAAKTEERS